MDIAPAFKSDVFRSISTLLVPGVVALAPYALLLNHYQPGIVSFADHYGVVYVALYLFAALAAGFVLEDLGSHIEGEVWDELIQRETRCQESDWLAFLTLSPEANKEKVGHRYLRTIILRLKFELSFGLALILLWFGLLLLDATLLLWTEAAVSVLSIVVLCPAAYLLWESYRSSWVLANLRHLLLHGSACVLEKRKDDEGALAHWVNVTLIWSAAGHGIWGVLQLSLHLWPGSPLEHRAGLSSAALHVAFGVISGLTWLWMHSDEAKGRRRGVCLRLGLATALFGFFLQLRDLSADRPTSLWMALVLGVLAAWYLRLAQRLWAGPPGPPGLGSVSAQLRPVD
jgi:hypothetical protein